ncbi:MAG: 50S ribosomal protein L24, partial [bacterium]
MHIIKDDQVKVIAGKDLGKTGKVLRIDGDKNRAYIEKVNMIKKHLRPSKDNQQGEIRETEGSI